MKESRGGTTPVNGSPESSLPVYRTAYMSIICTTSLGLCKCGALFDDVDVPLDRCDVTTKDHEIARLRLLLPADSGNEESRGNPARHCVLTVADTPASTIYPNRWVRRAGRSPDSVTTFSYR